MTWFWAPLSAREQEIGTCPAVAESAPGEARSLLGAHLLGLPRPEPRCRNREGVTVSELDASLGTDFLLPLVSPQELSARRPPLAFPQKQPLGLPATVAMETVSLRGLASHL